MANPPSTPPAAAAGDSGRVPRMLAGALAVLVLDALLLVLAMGGVPALLGSARALALLGVWATGGIVLACLRPVRSHAPVELEQESKLSLIALLVVPVITPAVSALGERLGAVPWFASPQLEWAGVVAVAAGLGIRIAGMARLGSRFSPLVAVQREHALETGGIYACVRHPGYLGALLACAGAMVAFGSALSMPLVFAFVGLLGSRIEREENLLEQHFGDEFRRYRARTGGMWPRFGGKREP